MKRFSFSLLLGAALLSTVVSLNSCQKDQAQTFLDSDIKVTDRAPNGFIVGITIFKSGNPSQVVVLDQATGAVNSNIGAFTIDNLGNTINLEDLKGVCMSSASRYYVTTGVLANVPAGSIYNNALFSLDPHTGMCTYISTSTQGTISDLECDANTNDFYGLVNNSNSVVLITAASGYAVYNAPVAITGIAGGYNLRGLSQVRDGNGVYYVGCANGKSSLVTKLYTVPVGGGAATFMTNLTPQIDLAAGNCGIGFDLDINQMIINRSAQFTAPTFGANSFAWATPFGATTATNFWGAAGFTFEDFTSSVY